VTLTHVLLALLSITLVMAHQTAICIQAQEVISLFLIAINTTSMVVLSVDQDLLVWYAITATNYTQMLVLTTTLITVCGSSANAKEAQLLTTVLKDKLTQTPVQYAALDMKHGIIGQDPTPIVNAKPAAPLVMTCKELDAPNFL